MGKTGRHDWRLEIRIVFCKFIGLSHHFCDGFSFKKKNDMAKIVVDLHDCFNNGTKIDAALNNAIDEAVSTGTKLVEIIPGKGSGQLKKSVLRFLEQKHIKQQYHRIEKDSKNFGRLFVHFKF